MAQLDIRTENELQTRSRIVRNHLKDRDNCIVLKIDTQMTSVGEISPFGFHFELDKKKFQERKKHIRREQITQWFSWIAFYHHKFGIRHLLLVLMLVAYVFMGGAIFESLEAPREIEDLSQTILLMNGIIGEMTLDVINVTLTYNGTQRIDKVQRLIKKYYKTMLEAEGRFHGSVWHKAENLEMHLMWYYSSATFYAMTLFTTIGYGTIACQTVAGKVISVVYACIGIPLMLVVLGDIGEWFQKLLTKGYIFLYLKYKAWRQQKVTQDLDEIFLPIWIALPLVGIYILSTALFIRLFDHNEGNMPGIDFGGALYFTFISLTTIGLGDVMPYNIQYSPILASVFLLGLALVSIVNTSIYAQLYGVFFDFVEAMEKQLDRIHKEHHKGPGYRVFQDLEPCIRLLVCSFPYHGSLGRDVALESILKPAGNATATPTDEPKKDKKVTYSAVVRKRTISYSGEKEEGAKDDKKGARLRAPTLGALGGMDLSKFRKQREASKARSNSTEIQPAPVVLQRRGSDAAGGSKPLEIPSWNPFKWRKEKETKKEDDVEAEKESVEDTTVRLADSSSLDTVLVDETETPTVVRQDTEETDDGPYDEHVDRRSTRSSTEDSDPEPANRPPPLLVLPPKTGSDDSDESDDDDDWAPPTSRFANLNKRGSVFVPSTRNEEDSDGEGPSVEYIP